MEETESRLRQKALVGVLATGRAGLGYFPKTQASRVWRNRDISYSRKMSEQLWKRSK